MRYPIHGSLKNEIPFSGSKVPLCVGNVPLAQAGSAQGHGSVSPAQALPTEHPTTENGFPVVVMPAQEPAQVR